MERLRREEGFTIIELLVVVVILGVLLGIALPTFLGARTRAQDKAAQSSLRTGLAVVKVCLTDTGDYAGCDSGTLTAIDGSAIWDDTGAPSTAPDRVSYAVTSSTWAAAALSDSGTCWMVLDDLLAGLSYGQGNPASCDAAAAALASDESW